MSTRIGNSEMTEPSFEGFVILELMGHRRLSGWLSQQEIGGGSFLRLDIHKSRSEIVATQFYSPAAIYCITPTNEATAFKVAEMAQPALLQRWELPPASEESEVDDRGFQAISRRTSGDSAMKVSAIEVAPGDLVESESGERRQVARLEHTFDEVILFDEEGECLILGADWLVTVVERREKAR